MTTMQWPAVSRAALPPAVPGEFIPRRDHVVRLFWIAVVGLLPASVIAAVPRTELPFLFAVFVILGAAVGAGQMAWCWRGTVPRLQWVLLSALGWATGAIGGALVGSGVYLLLGFAGVDLRPGAVYQMVGIFSGAGAGWNSASLQGMLLRRQGRSWKWWVYASAGTAALAALFPMLIRLGCGWS